MQAVLVMWVLLTVTPSNNEPAINAAWTPVEVNFYVGDDALITCINEKDLLKNKLRDSELMIFECLPVDNDFSVNTEETNKVTF